MISKEIFHIHHIHSYPTSHSFSLPSSKTHHVSSGGKPTSPSTNVQRLVKANRLPGSLGAWILGSQQNQSPSAPSLGLPKSTSLTTIFWGTMHDYMLSLGKCVSELDRMSTFIAHLKFTWTRVFHAATIHPKLKYLHISWFIHIIHHHPVHSQTRRA